MRGKADSANSVINDTRMVNFSIKKKTQYFDFEYSRN
jgi:hypothetical protein